MRIKKHSRKTKKQRNYKSKTKNNKSRSRHNKRGGGLFDFLKGTSSVVVPENCDPMKLTQLNSSAEMRNNYQTCCPKKYFGLVKNSSPYCKQLDLNFKSAVEREGMDKQYLGMEPQEVAGMQNAPMLPAAPTPAPEPISGQQENVNFGGKTRRKKRRLSKYRKH